MLDDLSEGCADVFVGANHEQSERIRQLVETLLSPAEREVVRVSMHWYDPNQSRCYLPPNVLAGLCKQLRTTKENIRRLRKTAFDRIRDVLERETNGSSTCK